MQEQFGTRHLFIFLIIAFLLATTIAAVALSDDWQLLTSATDTTTTSSPSGMEIITSNGLQELSNLRGCAENEILKMNAGNLWACAADNSSAATGVGVVVLDLGDNGVNESTAIGEIATTGDTNGCFTEPSADKLLITVSPCRWPGADNATALAANGANCAAASFPLGVDAAGAVEGCSTSISGNAATATALAANGANCGVGNYARGVDASGVAEDCSADVDTNANTLCAGTTTYLDGDGGCDDIAPVYANVSGDTFTGEIVLSINCSAFASGGALTTSATGAMTCSDDNTGGGGANSFETMNAATGTDPVADSSTDTLNLEDSLTISVTGSAATDSLSWEVSAPNCTDTSGQHLNFTGGDFTCGTSSSTNSFTTQDAASGTDPVADSSADTLQWLEGTNITITGSAAGDSITIAATGSAAAVYNRSLTLTGSIIDADVELYTHTKSINILDPTTSESNQIQFYLPLAGTITRIACSTDVGTVTIQFDERAEATPNTAGTNVMTSSLVCDTDSQTTTAFDNASIAARVPVNLQISATASTPNVVRIHVEYTQDD